MTELNNQHPDEVALFRYGLISDLIHMPPGWRELGMHLAKKAELSYAIPRSTRTRVAAETLRHWLKAYRKGGFEALKPRPRRDAGTSHALPRHVADLLCHLKEERLDYSVQLVIREAIASGQVPEGLPLPPSTVHRLLSRAGLMKKPAALHLDHRRFEFDAPNELWMSDVMHGPQVAVGQQKRKAYLIGLIDDASRLVPHAAFALAENTSAFLPVLKQALLRRGIPKRLFVDNGSAFRSHHLALVCAKLGITLIHARAYHPEAKGKQERWFRTVRLQLLPRLTPQDLASLEALNRRLCAYIEGEYHRSPHKGLEGMSPLDAWTARAAPLGKTRTAAGLEELFLLEERRKVAKDRTVSLHGIAFEVDATLVGSTVVLRYDPDRPRGPVQVWSDGKRQPDAKPVDTRANCFVRRARPAPIAADAPRSTLRLSDLDRSNKEGR